MAIEYIPGRAYQLSAAEDYKDFRRDLQSVVDEDIWNAYDDASNWAILMEAFGSEISLPSAVEIFNRFRSTNRIVSSEDREAAEQEQAEEESSEQVVEPSEHEIFYTTRSSREIRERIARDPEFGRYARARMAGEVVQGAGVSERFYWSVLKTQVEKKEDAPAFVELDTNGLVLYDSAWPVIESQNEYKVPVFRKDGGPALEVTDIHPALRKFAQQYTQTPSSQLRPIAGYVTLLDGSRYTVQKFNDLVSEASLAHLF